MSSENKPQSVSIRLSHQTRSSIQAIAKKEYRTFCDQCRMILDQWARDNCKSDKEIDYTT